MKKKLPVILALSVIACLLLGTGVWFLVKQSSPGTGENIEITVSPAPNTMLTNSAGESSYVILKNVTIEKATSDKQYIQLSQNRTIAPGDSILTMNLTIQNTHPNYKIVGLSATGYDASGKLIAQTLDDTIHQMAWTELKYQETGEVILHLNYADNIKSIKINGSVYQYAVP